MDQTKGGYFIAFDSLDGCAKAIVARCKKAGLVMTGAGATYPYGKDPHDTNIRIAPSYPPLSDLIPAMDLFALCTKIVGIDKILKDRAEAQEAPDGHNVVLKNKIESKNPCCLRVKRKKHGFFRYFYFAAFTAFWIASAITSAASVPATFKSASTVPIEAA